MENILYLASSSQSRKNLLQKARIPFTIIEQNADESLCDWNLPLQQLVESIAQYKMDHVIMPLAKKENEITFVLTADTLSIDTQGNIRGKPKDMQEAIAMLKAARGPNNRCGTAFCLEKKQFKNNAWQTVKQIMGYAQATYEIDIPDTLMEHYIVEAQTLKAAGAIKIEEGAQFVKSVHGSYTAIVGLAMFELRCALMEIGFF